MLILGTVIVLHLLLLRNRGKVVARRRELDEHVALVFLRKALVKTVLMLPDPPHQIISDTNVKRAVSLIGHDVDRVLHKNNLDSRLRGMMRMLYRM